jgi:hypothetical protein
VSASSAFSPPLRPAPGDKRWLLADYVLSPPPPFFVQVLSGCFLPQLWRGKRRTRLAANHALRLSRPRLLAVARPSIQTPRLDTRFSSQQDSVRHLLSDRLAAATAPYRRRAPMHPASIDPFGAQDRAGYATPCSGLTEAPSQAALAIASAFFGPGPSHPHVRRGGSRNPSIAASVLTRSP